MQRITFSHSRNMSRYSAKGSVGPVFNHPTCTSLAFLNWHIEDSTKMYAIQLPSNFTVVIHSFPTLRPHYPQTLPESYVILSKHHTKPTHPGHCLLFR